MNQANKVDPTKERLLDEAEILFAGKGYHAVSVREITRAANCNLAAQSIRLETAREDCAPAMEGWLKRIAKLGYITAANSIREVLHNDFDSDM